MQRHVPRAAFALWLLARVQGHGTALAILRGGARLTRVAALAEVMAVDTDVLALAAVDVLPYDRARPSTVAIGRRVRTLMVLTHVPARPRLVLTSAASALIRVRPPRAWNDAVLALHTGETIGLETLRLQLADRGYHWDEHADEPGEVALRGHAIDLFPADNELPARLDLDDARCILAIQTFGPFTQRTIAPVETVSLGPAIEHPPTATSARPPLRHSKPTLGSIQSSPPSLHRPQRRTSSVSFESWTTCQASPGGPIPSSPTAEPPPPRPSRLYITSAQAAAALTGPTLAAATSDTRLPYVGFGDAVAAPARIADFVRDAQTALAVSVAVVIATPAEPERVAASLARRGLQARVAANWTEATAGTVAVLRMEAAEGLRTPALLLLPIGAMFRPNASNQSSDFAVDAPCCGDIVVHADHGAACLKHLRTIGTDSAPEERVALDFADDTELLVPVGELTASGAMAAAKGAFRSTASAATPGAADARKPMPRSTPPPAAPRRRPRRSRPLRSPMPRWPAASRIRRPVASAPPSTLSLLISRAAVRWITWSAATSASARPKSHFTPPPPRPLPASTRAWCGSTLALAARR